MNYLAVKLAEHINKFTVFSLISPVDQRLKRRKMDLWRMQEPGIATSPQVVNGILFTFTYCCRNSREIQITDTTVDFKRTDGPARKTLSSRTLNGATTATASVTTFLWREQKMTLFGGGIRSTNTNTNKYGV